MIDGTLVVDAVVHAINGSRNNVAEPIEPMAEPGRVNAETVPSCRRSVEQRPPRSEERWLQNAS
jgi:hypothetical protein